MYFKRFIMAILAVLLLSSCGHREYVEQNSALIVFKTPTFKYADMGFIYKGASSTKVEIYSSGKSMMTLKISKGSICMSLLKCLTAQGFNNQVLSHYYPKDTLWSIFRGKPIFGGLSLKRIRNGFTQNIDKDGEYNISYSVLYNETIFRDTINNILIKIKKVN
ncbi:MAG: hypothetical protein QM493_03810 [Sulfurovum sp.]